MLLRGRLGLGVIVVALAFLTASGGGGSSAHWLSECGASAAAVAAGEDGSPAFGACTVGCICPALASAADAAEPADFNGRPRAERAILPSGQARPPGAGPPKR